MKKTLTIFMLLLLLNYAAKADNTFNEDFETVTQNEEIALAGWTNHAETGTVKWIGKSYSDNLYAQMSSYNSGEENIAWLISPAVNLDEIENDALFFDVNVGYYTHNGLQILYSTDFDGTNIADATWTEITDEFTIPQEPTGGYGTFAPAGSADLSSISGSVYIAFKYTGDANNSQTTTYQIDNVVIKAAASVILEDAFEGGLSNWNLFSVVGDDQIWTISEDKGVNESQAAYMNGYSGGNNENEDWLITPALDITALSSPALSFYSACNYNGDDIVVKYSTDYSGSGAPSAATWNDFSGIALSAGSYTWTFSGNIPLSEIASPSLYIAFVYSSTTEDGKAWYIDNVMVGEYTPNSEAEISGFVLTEQISEAIIDNDNFTIEITVAPGTDLSALTPEIQISTGADISPESATAQDFTNPVTYTVTAEDGTTRDWTVTVTALSDSPTDIYEIQFVEGSELHTDNGNSPLLDQTVIVNGIVTAFSSFGSYNLFYIQSKKGAWNGIYVYDPNTGVVLSQGDSVKVIGNVAEYYNLTEIEATSVEILATRKAIPEPCEVTGALEESLEGVLVQLTNVSVSEDTDDSDSKKHLTTKVNGEDVKIYDHLYADFTPDAEVNYNIIGTVIYTYDYYRICPRDALDISEVTALQTTKKQRITIYPNPCSHTLYIKNLQVKKVSIVNIAGKVVKTVNVINNSIPVADLKNGMYTLIAGNKTIRFVKQ